MSSKNEVIEVALKEFLLNGYQKTSLNTIADKLGMTKPALYYYFKSKKELFLACIERFFSSMNKASMDYKDDSLSAKDRIKDIIINFSNPSMHLEPELQDRNFDHSYFVTEAIKNVPEVQELYMQASQGMMIELENIISAGISKGELREDIDIEALIMEIGVFIEGMARSYNMGFFDEDKGIIDRMFELLWNGIGKN